MCKAGYSKAPIGFIQVVNSLVPKNGQGIPQIKSRKTYSNMRHLNASNTKTNCSCDNAPEHSEITLKLSLIGNLYKD